MKYPQFLFKLRIKAILKLSRISNLITLTGVSEALRDVIKAQPSLAKDVLNTLQNEYYNYPSAVYRILRSIVKVQPSLAKDVLNTFNTALRSNKNDGYSLLEAYRVLRHIVDDEPSLAKEVLNTFNTALQSNKNYNSSLSEAYKGLIHLVEAQPSLAKDVLDTFNTALQSDKNDGQLLINAYKVLRHIVDDEPSLAKEVLNTFNAALQSNKNHTSSLSEAYKGLIHLVEAQPSLAKDVLNTFNTALQSDKNNGQSLISAYELLEKIVITQPSLVNKETIAKYLEIEQFLQIVYKGHFNNHNEVLYALECFSKETLAESMIFRAQQRVMNVLVSTSAQEKGISKEDALAFRKPDAPEAVKDYIKNNEDWLIPASFKGAAIFKEYFPAYIKTIQNHNQKNPEDKLSIHDAVYWLPEPMKKEANERFALFIQKNIIYQTVDENGKHKMVHRPLNELKIIAQNWKKIEKKLQNREKNAGITKLKYNDVLSICMSVKYEDQRNDVFAIEAAKHGTSEAGYHNCEDIYLAGLKVPEPFDSKKEFKEGKYTGRFLPREDPRTLFFGDYTDCCQHYGGVGHACAVSTVKHPFSQLFVIEDDKGKIIAGSWTWENTEGKYREACFDNIESLGELECRPEINKIYEQVGNYLTKKENCRRVTIGLGNQDADVSKYKSTKAITLPKLYNNGYSDAHSQVLLSENPNAKPLDKTQESQRYIRDVCFLDMEAMDRVSYAVFPDGDKQLQAPDNMTGFVIEDREKGVVGYCLYDSKEKSIYDMAVLPEYRTDKNASSRKLFAEMMRTINKEGGQWSAEMRDETTLKYLKVMAERGLVKYEEHGIDHTMSDGSKVVAVTFEPIREEVRQATNKLKKSIEEGKEKEEVSSPKSSVRSHRNGHDSRN